MSLPVRIALAALRRPERHEYGGDASQVADLHLPPGHGPHPVVVVLHGGHWRTGFGKLVTRPIAVDLARRGLAAWNLEYRRLGRGGGWPMTFQDVGAGIDHLATLADPRLDLARVTLLGHSAGGHLALWAAGRGTSPPDAVGSSPRVLPTHVAALAPVTDLASAGRAARELVGGSPEDRPERWAQVDPARRPPPPMPTLVAHGEADQTIDVERSRRYVARCSAEGGDIRLLAPPGEVHRDPIDPSSASWAAVLAWL